MTCVNAKDLDESNLSLDDNQNIDILSESGISTPTESDVSSANKTDNDSESQCYLILDNDADTENVYIGDYVTWIVSVINKGPDMAKNVKVYDQLPDGMKYIKHTTTKGTFNPETGIWFIGNLTVIDGEVFLNITTQALTAGEKINKANLTTDTHNLNENESYEEEEIDVLEHDKDADKSIHSIHATGNPIALIVLSIFAILITSIKSK